MQAEKTRDVPEEQTAYFGMLAEINHTKHLGGITATRKLAELCGLGENDYVLDVGCGVGITPVILVRQYGCRLVGVDLMQQMIDRSLERAQREGVGELTEFRVADARELPFEDATFDAVISESVLSFTIDKQQTVNELVRVTKPGGHIAFTEAIWLQQPKPELADYLASAAGLPTGLLQNEDWRAILVHAGLQDIFAQSFNITTRTEASDQFRRLGLRNYLRTMGGALKVIFRPHWRSMIRGAIGQPIGEYYQYIGYGIYAGRKP